MKISINVADEAASSLVLQNDTTLPGGLSPGVYQATITLDDGAGNVQNAIVHIAFPPAGTVFLNDSDGAYLTDQDGAYLTEIV